MPTILIRLPQVCYSCRASDTGHPAARVMNPKSKRSFQLQVNSGSRCFGGNQLSLGDRRHGFQACAMRHGCRQTTLHGSKHRLNPFQRGPCRSDRTSRRDPCGEGRRVDDQNTAKGCIYYASLSGRLAPCGAVKKRTGLPASAKARLARGRSHGGSMLTVVSWSAGRPVDKTAGRALAALSCALALGVLCLLAVTGQAAFETSARAPQSRSFWQ